MNKGLLVLNLAALIVTLNILVAEPGITGHAVAEGDTFTVSKPVKVAAVVIILIIIIDVLVYVAELKKAELKKFGSSIQKKVEKNVKIDIKSQNTKKPGKIIKIESVKKKAGRRTKR